MQCQGEDSLLVLRSDENLPVVLRPFSQPQCLSGITAGQTPHFIQKDCLGFCLKAKALVISYLEGQTTLVSTAPYHSQPASDVLVSSYNEDFYWFLKTIFT